MTYFCIEKHVNRAGLFLILPEWNQTQRACILPKTWLSLNTVQTVFGPFVDLGLLLKTPMNDFAVIKRKVQPNPSPAIKQLCATECLLFVSTGKEQVTFLLKGIFPLAMTTATMKHLLKIIQGKFRPNSSNNSLTSVHYFSFLCLIFCAMADQNVLFF